MKNVKTLLIPVGLIFLVLGIVSFTNPQDEMEGEKCTIKLVKIVNGIKTEVDSTFDCNEEMVWESSFTEIEESLEKMIGSIIIKGESDESSFSFNMDFNEDEENGVKIMKLKAKDGEDEVDMSFDFKELDEKEGEGGVFKMRINGEEMEINIGNIKREIEGLDKNSENVKIFIGTEEDGLGISIDVEDDNQEESKKIIILSKIVTDKNASSIKESTLKELNVDELKFSPNPNDGKFDLSFELNKKNLLELK